MSDLAAVSGSESGESSAEVSRHVGDVLMDSDGDRFSVGVIDHDDSRRLDAARLILTSDFEPDWYGWREKEGECVAAVAPLLRPITLRQHITYPFHEHDEECAPTIGASDALALWNDEGDPSLLTCGEEERCCGCEDEGWWCEEGDGPPRPWFDIDRSKLDEALNPIYLAWMEDRAE